MHCMLYLLSHICTYALDHAEPKSKIQAEQVQGVFGGPQMSSYEDANIFMMKASPGASNRHP
jgi:hypothetical protein